MKKRVGTPAWVLAAAVALATSAWAQVPEQVEGIANYKRIEPGLAAAGTPSSAALQQLKALGFRTVVDLRTEGEGTAAERAAVEAQGLRYVSVPVTPASLSLEDVKAVGAVLDDPAAGPVLLHCASSNRVGAVYGALQALKGRSPADAETAAREAGLTSESMAAAMKRVAGEAAAPR
jgi:uncharacterized protein (TIGR01244 family)